MYGIYPIMETCIAYLLIINQNMYEIEGNATAKFTSTKLTLLGEINVATHLQKEKGKE